MSVATAPSTSWRSPNVNRKRSMWWVSNEFTMPPPGSRIEHHVQLVRLHPRVHRVIDEHRGVDEADITEETVIHKAAQMASGGGTVGAVPAGTADRNHLDAAHEPEPREMDASREPRAHQPDPHRRIMSDPRDNEPSSSRLCAPSSHVVISV